MKIGFLGTGNMAQAIITGLLDSKHLEAKNIYCYARNQERLQIFTTKTKTNQVSSNDELIKSADIIVLAIPPQTFDSLLPEIAQTINEENKLVVSIAAGYKLADLENYFTTKTPIIRAMPSVNVKVQAGLCALCANDNVSTTQFNEISALFDAIGKSFVIEEKMFATFSAVGGASPAYTFMYIEALAQAGLRNGLEKKIAIEIAAQAVLGSAKMVLEQDLSPWDLIETVCSPGGTTIAGVVSLEENAFVGTVVNGVQATIDKDKEVKD